MKISYEQACKNIKLNNCLPLFSEEEWEGSRNNKKIIKYWFRDKMGHDFYCRYDSVANGRKTCCNKCSKQSQINNQKLNKDEYDNVIKDFKINKNIRILTVYKDYKNIRQKLKCKCLLCSKIFNESIDNIRKKDSHGCETIPKGERIVIDMFEKNGIDYKYQIYIQELNVTSDFEIKLKNNSILHLEIDGDQHYDFPNEFHKNYDDFLKQQYRDSKKDNWYSKQGYKNLHIRYNIGGKKNDNIELVINNIIKSKYGKCETKNINKNFNIMNLLNKSNKNKKVIAYTLDGNFYEIFENMLEAEKKLNVDNACISECVYQKRNIKRAGNFIFKLYEENYPLHIEPYKKSSEKSILIFKNGIFIEEIKSLNATARKYNIYSSSLCRYLKGKCKNPSLIYDFSYKQN